VDSIIKNIKSMEPITAMKEANSVIARKGKYKNLTEEQSKKILQDTEDHIFERDIPEEDFASGGRAGFAGGSDMGTVADSKGKTGPSKGGYQGGGTGPVERPTGGGGGGNNNTTYDYTVPKQIVKDIAINTGKNLAGQKIASALGIGTTPIGILMALKGLYDQTQNPVYSEEDLTYGVPYQTGGRVGLKNGGKTITLMDGTKVYIPEGSTTSSGGLKDRIYSSSKGDLLREDIVRLMSFESGGRVGLRGGGADFIPTEKMNTNRMKIIREFLKRKMPHLDSGPIDKSILYDLQEALSSGSGLFPGYDVRNDLPREVEAKGGGRIGLAGGMTGKKGATKKVVKEVIKTPNAPGKPEWFDALVNKVILEGDDVTKKLAIKDRQTVHTKKIDNDSEVTVYRDLDDNSVRVEYNSPDVMLDEPVSLTVKPGQADETIKKAPPAEFETYEQGFVARSNGPDDYSIDPEPMIGNSIKDLETDVTKLKEFATGEKQTLKEFVQSKKRKDKVKKINQGDIGETSDYVTKRQGDYYDYDDYASGGIAGMLGE
jgi:hypothetical protein